MFSELEPYIHYAFSGMQWLGDVPAHWEVLALKRLGWFSSGAGFPVEEQGQQDLELPFFKVSDMNLPGNDKVMTIWKNSVSLSTAERLGATIFPSGTIIFPKVDGALLTNKRRVVERPSCIDNNLMGCVVRRGNNSDFVLRLLEQIDLADIAKPGPVPAVSEGEVREIRTILPPLSEQVAIVNYLDHVDQHIQHYISVKKKLIGLLEEQRKAVIHRSVTRGLDPNVRIKPSAIEWDGNIPTHWNVRKILHCGVISGGMTPSMENRRFWDGAIPWVTPKDMKKAVIHDSILHVSEYAISKTSLKIIPPPAVLLVVRGMILAKKIPIAYTTTEVTINQDMKAIVPNAWIDAKFLALSMIALRKNFVPLIDEAGHGTRRLPTERWRELALPLPPLTEQAAIVEYLDKATADIDTAIDRTHREIELMREYRERLIADVVTGKLDVRKAAEKLPEPEEEADEPPPSGEAEVHTEDGRRVSDHVPPSSEVTGA